MTVDEIIANLDSAMEKSKLNQDIQLYRGLSEKALDKLAKAGKGKTVTEKGYMSLSVDPLSIPGEAKAIMVVNAPKGARMLAAGGDEVILHRSSKLKLVNAVEDELEFDLVSK